MIEIVDVDGQATSWRCRDYW